MSHTLIVKATRLPQSSRPTPSNSTPFAAIRHALEAVNHGLEMPFDEAELFEATLFGLCVATEDMKEGVAAFLEKRPAKFTGK